MYPSVFVPSGIKPPSNSGMKSSYQTKQRNSRVRLPLCGPIIASGKRPETLTQSAQYLPFIFPAKTICSNTLVFLSEVPSNVEIIGCCVSLSNNLKIKHEP